MGSEMCIRDSHLPQSRFSSDLRKSAYGLVPTTNTTSQRLQVSAFARTLYAVHVGHLNIQVLFNFQKPRRKVDLPRPWRKLVDVRHDGVSLGQQLVPVLAADQRSSPSVVFRYSLVLVVDPPGDVAVSNGRRRHLYYAKTIVVVTLPPVSYTHLTLPTIYSV